jgi:CO dehydrogenase maturation factor
MKIAVTGKGGVGKTTLSAMLSATLSLKGSNVVAIDADPDANLAAAFGLPLDKYPTFLAEMRDLIAERTGVANAYGGYFKLNPKVDDIPDEYSRRIGNVRLLALGGVSRGGGGCICPASSLVKALLTHLLFGSDDALIMDMEAGIEHLGRATAQSMDALLVVVDESPWSVQTAFRVRRLAADLGLQKLAAVVNRVRESTDIARIRLALDGIPIVGTIPYDPRLTLGIVTGALDQRLEPTDVLTALLPRINEMVRLLHSTERPGSTSC